MMTRVTVPMRSCRLRRAVVAIIAVVVAAAADSFAPLSGIRWAVVGGRR